MLKEVVIRDKVALSIISGVFGTMVMYGIGIPFYFLKMTKQIYLMYNINLFVTPSLAKTVPGFLAGIFVGLIVGGGLAFGFKLLIEWTGEDWIWLKAVAYASLMWFFWVGLVRNMLDVNNELSTHLWTNIFLLVQSWIYMLATTYAMIKLSGGREFISQSERKNN